MTACTWVDTQLALFRWPVTEEDLNIKLGALRVKTKDYEENGGMIMQEKGEDREDYEARVKEVDRLGVQKQRVAGAKDAMVRRAICSRAAKAFAKHAYNLDGKISLEE